jgi:hypothetical protein
MRLLSSLSLGTTLAASLTLLGGGDLLAQAKPSTAAPAAAAADPFLGSFVSEDGEAITVAKSGSTYSGVIRASGGEYAYSARKIGRALVGTFQAEGQSFMFSASVSGDRMTFTAGGETTMLTRGRAPAAARGVSPGRAGGTREGPPGDAPQRRATGQDAQIEQVLLSSPWCYMRYSQTLGSTSTERGVFYRDGRLVVQTGHEMVSSGQNGTAYGSGSGGAVYRWRVANGDLHLSENGGPFNPAGLRITQNSNGYPILNVDGKEYSQCR